MMNKSACKVEGSGSALGPSDDPPAPVRERTCLFFLKLLSDEPTLPKTATVSRWITVKCVKA